MLFAMGKMRGHVTCTTKLKSTKKYKSIPFLFDCDLLDCINFHEYDALICATIKSKTSELCLTVVLLHKANNSNPLNFTQYMEWIMARYNLNVVLGNFNEEFFKERVL